MMMKIINIKKNYIKNYNFYILFKIYLFISKTKLKNFSDFTMCRLREERRKLTKNENIDVHSLQFYTITYININLKFFIT